MFVVSSDSIHDKKLAVESIARGILPHLLFQASNCRPQFNDLKVLMIFTLLIANFLLCKLFSR